MTDGSGATTAKLDALLAGIDEIAGREAGDAAERIGRVLHHAAGARRSESDRSDPATLRAFEEWMRPDLILERIDLAGLAGLLERVSARAEEAAAAGADTAQARRRVWDALDLVRRSAVLRRIPPAETDLWAARILRAVESSQFTVGALFHHRAETYGSKVLFQVPRADGHYSLTWRGAASRVEHLARGLWSLDPDGNPGPVAILSENRVEMALVDLACLCFGLVNVMVPANSTGADVLYMLRHSRTRTLIVSGRAQLRKVLNHRDELPDLRHIVSIDPPGDGAPHVLGLDRVMSRFEQVPYSRVRERADAVGVDDLATVMYTSGTTGTPKGIQFSHRNLVFKRFARALALPEIGEQDVFLCFLPLCHTFGRYLEMLGCVYWGATYCFLESTSVEALIHEMRVSRPTVFISVPKKWIQIHERIVQKADPQTATDEEIGRAVREVTGGALRWGLSAAGYLDPEIFRLLQRNGVELMSGFGMTEATGGITMTPPGEYREDSLGLPLPGIEVRLADDGELLVRGPYVTIGHLDPPDGAPSFDDEGWFHTGDLMRVDGAGHLRLVDRKKEIYKNVKGETIAPQRVENLFRDLESVGRAFLVGDHREYNTLLIYPNHGSEEIDFGSMSEAEMQDHFRSLVVSVNKFLAPYERIVDFAVIERDLCEDRDELTAKGTPKRRIVAANFAPEIRSLYRRTELRVGGVELTIPNWLFQTLGLTAQDIRVEQDRIVLSSTGAGLDVRRENETTVCIGACRYSHTRTPINLGSMLNTPRMWLGNEQLVDLFALDAAARRRPGRTPTDLRWLGRATPFRPSEHDLARLHDAAARSEWNLLDVDLAARMLFAAERRPALAAADLLQRIAANEEAALSGPCLLALTRASAADDAALRRRAFQIIVPTEHENRFPQTLARFLRNRPGLLDQETMAILCELRLSEARVEAFAGLAEQACLGTADRAHSDRLALKLLDFLSAYGAGHPTRYRRLRALLVRMSLFAAGPEVRERAGAAIEALQAGFHRWLGPNSRIAVDPETGQEYGWDDTVVFADDVALPDRRRLLSAIERTALLSEAVFLFSSNVLIRLSDVPPRGVWIRLLGSRHGKAVYRVTVQTRFQGHHDLAVNLNHQLSDGDVRDEIQCLILSGDSGDGSPLVEDFGGYWAEQDLWSEEFISGETLGRAMQRLSRSDDGERLATLWPFLAWTALSGYADFWQRSGRRWEIADPSMTNVIVPTDDFHTGVRIVSVSARRAHRNLLEMARSFMTEFIEPAETQYPHLRGKVDWPVIFSSVLEVIGEDEGLKMFRDALDAGADRVPPAMQAALEQYLSNVRVRGFLPRRLFFAAKRYRTWALLSANATLQARARTLQELYETYGLSGLAREYPETRVRFFREAVFRDSPEALTAGLDELIRKIREQEVVGEEMIDAVADLRSTLDLGAEDDYFLARVSLPYLRPEDAADFVSSHLGGQHQSEIVVTLADLDGNNFRVRHALSPKEVERLHRLFLASKLDVRFRPEHRYLVAISERSQIIGGIYYEIEESGGSAHLEKIVVTERLRRKGVADGLMKQLFNRLRAAGVEAVTTGFFRPEYFYGYGFRIEKRYAGLVRSLTHEETT